MCDLEENVIMRDIANWERHLITMIREKRDTLIMIASKKKSKRNTRLTLARSWAIGDKERMLLERESLIIESSEGNKRREQ